MKADFKVWWKLSMFSLDIPEIDFSFSDRLARENGWSKEYTNRVIEEYKKFVFLSFVSGKSLTPSDEVDQAWHLHMIYSRSYWDEMCMGILNGFKLYHGPTKGGKVEADRFHRQYQHTKEMYAEVFNETPPVDIWPSAEKRFSPMDWKRIDVSKNFILSKKKVKEYMISYAFPIAGAFVISLFTGSASKTEEDSNFWWWVLWIGIAIFVIRGIYRYLNRHERRSGSSSSSGSSYDSGCSVMGSFFGCGSSDSGCGSSGCSSSGCSGCGGGCGGCGS